VAVYIAINLFQIGGDEFIIDLNYFIVLPLALSVTLLAFAVWRQTETGNKSKFLWLGLAIGWGLWTFAELWWAIAAAIGQEVPYPSWADFFWLVGYIPIYFAFWARIRTLPKIENSEQQIGLFAILLAFIGLTVFLIIVPIIQNSDPSAILENTISILYPLADLFIIIFVMRLLFSYQQGIYGQAWRWLAVGFILMSLGDLVFSYAVTENIYYPDQQVNFISTLGIDVPYSLSYLIWIIGLLLFQKLLKTFKPISVSDTKLTLVPNTHLLIFTKGDDTVIDVSRNSSRIFLNDTVPGNSISETLGISLEDQNTILKEIKLSGVLNEQTLNASTRLGLISASISGIAASNHQQEYSGLILLVRILTDDYSLNHFLTDYEKTMVNSLTSKTDVLQKEQTEKKKLLTEYYQAFLRSFYNRAFVEGGSIMADAFITELQSTARQLNRLVIIEPNLAIYTNRLSFSEAQKILPAVFETAKQFIINLTDETTANAIVQEIRSKLGEAVLQNVAYVETSESK
jgi:hypothetical protein